MASKQQGYSKDTLCRTASKTLHTQVMRCPCKKHQATPNIVGKAANQPWFTVFFLMNLIHNFIKSTIHYFINNNITKGKRKKE